MNWESLFKTHILERGYDYYLEDAVKDIKENKGIISATVCETDDYDVEITMENKKIVDMYCSCPHAASGANCKHMAAVLYEWEAKDGDELAKEEYSFVEKETDNIEEIVNQASEELLKKFVSKILHEDTKLLTRFKTLVDPNITPLEMKQFERQIDRTVDHYLGRNHFISYYEAFDFILAMEEYLHEDVRMMIDNGCYISAFDLTCYLFIKVADVDIDDSDGGTGMFADECIEVWNEILNYADEKTEVYMYKRLKSYLDGSIIDYMEEHIEDFLMSHFTSERFIQEQLDFTAMKVNEAKRSDDGWFSNYRASKWALNHIELMEKANCDQDSINQYYKENWQYSRIRERYINNCIKLEKYDEAIDILKESIEMDFDSPGLIKEYRKKLKDIYKKLNNIDAYQQQLWFLITKDDAGNLDVFKELKTLYSQSEWLKVREKIFTALPKYANIDKLYQEEKLYDRLLEYVLNTNGLNALYIYEDDLKNLYPEIILQKYIYEINEMARYTANRKEYQEWVYILRRMQKLKGGKEKVTEIVNNWKNIYKNRSAMMDELKKL